MTYPSNFTLPSEVLEAIAQEGIYRGFAESIRIFVII